MSFYPGDHEFRIKPGQTWNPKITLMAGTTPAPVDLTGYSAAMLIKKSTKTSDVIATVTCTIDPDQSGANKGVIQLGLTSVETAALPAESSLRYDLRVYIEDGVSVGVDIADYWLEGKILTGYRITP